MSILVLISHSLDYSNFIVSMKSSSVNSKTFLFLKIILAILGICISNAFQSQRVNLYFFLKPDRILIRITQNFYITFLFERYSHWVQDPGLTAFFFSFSPLKILLCCLLACAVSDIKSAIILYLYFSSGNVSFPPGCFKDFSHYHWISTN